MKKTIYTDAATSYYPVYTSGKICIIYFTVFECLFLFSSMPTFIKNLLQWNFNGTLIAVPITLLFYLSVCTLIYRRMYINICFNSKSISISNIKRKENLIIPWSNVKQVIFHKENWPARERYELILSKPICNHKPFNKSKSSYFIMIDDVNMLEIERCIAQEKQRK